MDQIIGSLIVRLDAVDSTNNYANGMTSRGGVKEGTVFLAYEQTGGRGQRTNKWESLAGENLTFSIVLEPFFLPVVDQFMLSKVVTLGIYSAVKKHVVDLKVKWPNDIYVGRKKLAGILIENSIMNGLLKYSVVGIGLNVNQIEFLSDAPNPVSLKMLTKNHFDCDIVLENILKGIDSYYKLLKSSYFDLINKEFESVLFQRNELCKYKSGDEVFDGTIRGVNQIGQLLIEKANGQLLSFHFKEVEFILD
ncbi:MAG TPA: biotin--[acetyl-CoA-carboxylase] ligase [Prolixibacteraceae bacterium]|nr:biotin--[acetyl-CoA-carboxylase] ligase [Prolixibacteraceae bacterium]